MDFFYSQLFVTPHYPTKKLDGQTIIITGSNGGLGKEAARHCVRLNAQKVILAVRNIQAGEEAKTDIEQSEGRTEVCQVWKLDLGNYESVKTFANRVINELDRLDVVVENAGIAPSEFRKLENNESSITVNVISTFLLTLLLLPKLQNSAQRHRTQPKVAIVTSEVHRMAKFPERNADHILDILSDQAKANMDERYPVSKLLEVLVLRHLAPIIKSSGNHDVTVNMLNPGLCHSSLSRESDSWTFWAMRKILARTTEVGSRTLMAAVVAGPESHGTYMSDGLVNDNAVAGWVRGSEGDRVGAKLWGELGVKLEAASPGVLKSLQ